MARSDSNQSGASCLLRVKSDGISIGVDSSAMLKSRRQPTQLNLRFARRSRFWPICPFQSPLFSCRWWANGGFGPDTCRSARRPISTLSAKRR
jgi:hypothetical protein